MLWRILAILAAKVLLLFRGSKPTSKLDAVSGFNFDRFSGTWYSAYDLPQPFKTKLSATSSDYSRNKNGTIKVTNRGYNKKKKKWRYQDTVARFRESEDIGWFVVETSNPLEKQTKIIYLNEDYTQAVVVGLTMSTMRIIYRDPNLTKRDLDALIARADKLGFKTSKLIRVDQSRSSE